MEFWISFAGGLITASVALCAGRWFGHKVGYEKGYYAGRDRAWQDSYEAAAYNGYGEWRADKKGRADFHYFTKPEIAAREAEKQENTEP